jgi:hypothetical protein
MKDDAINLKSNREFDRLPFAEDVSVTFQVEPVSGSGKNISAAGIYFIADADVQVQVRIGDREIIGHLVRVENHGRGRTGIAVKFADRAFD